MTMNYSNGWNHFADHDDETSGMSWSVWHAPSKTSDADIEAWIDECFPAERCMHAHDCCGNRYHSRAHWSVHVDVRDAMNNGTKVIVLSRRWIINI